MEWAHFISTVLLSLFFAALIYSAYSDLTKGKIYNWITYPAILLGLIFRILSDGKAGFISSLFGAFLGFIFLFVFFAIDGGVSAGDVKLTTAIGSFGGSLFLLHVLYYTAITGGFVAIFILLIKGELRDGIKRTFIYMGNLFLPRDKRKPLSKGPTVPYGAVIVVGTFLAFFLAGI
jgi:prepilin peptidase CpaA